MKALTCCLLLALCAPLAAQASNITVTGEGTAASWTIADSARMDAQSMLEAYSTTRGIKVIYDARRLGSGVLVTGKNISLTGDEIDHYVSNVLAEARMTLMPRGAGQYVVLPAAEAASSAPTMSEQEFATAKDWTWVTVTVVLENAEANVVRSVVQNMVSRQGGQASPARSALVVTDRADRLRQVIKTIREIDEAAKTEVRGYDLPNGVEPAVGLKAIQALFTNEMQNREASFSIQEGTSRILVRMRPNRHAEVLQAVNALK